MKLLTLLITSWLIFAASLKSAEPSQKPLKDVTFNLRSLESKQTYKYKWLTVAEKGGKREAKDYAVLVMGNDFDKGAFLLHDTITLARSYNGMVYDRRLKYPGSNLLHPERITLDISGQGQSVREMSYENAEMKIVDFSGTTSTQHVAFEDGILTFNTLLRLAPLLPRDIGITYTFRLYAEPFLFRIREAEQADGWTLKCETAETIKVGGKAYDCIRFRMDLKSVQARTDVWVGTKNNLVVKFVDALPMGADATTLEATLQE